jgi:hypothetical protein
VIRVPWQLYKVYGDTTVMRENYDAMVEWLDYEAATKAENDGDIRGLGDWASGEETEPQAIIDYGYYEGVATMVKVARVLGKSADVEEYRQLAASLESEYNAKYLHTDDAGRAWYANNTQASNAVALDSGLVPARHRRAVLHSLVRAVSAFDNRIGPGSVALGPLFRVLHASGRDDLLFKMVTNPASPGYAYLVNTGRTTLTEGLDGGGSQNHHFFGQVADWFVRGLAGIGQAPGSTAYRELLIRPAIVGDLDRASGSYVTPAGRAAVSWRRTSSGVDVRVTIPANTTAEIWLPVVRGDVNAPPAATRSRTATLGGSQYAVYDVGPGTHRFAAAR